MVRVLPRLLVLLAPLLVASLATPPAVAFHDPAPLLEERVVEGPFWTAWRVGVTAPDTVVSFEIANPTSDGRHQTGYGLWTMRVGQEKPHFFVVGTGGTRVTEVVVHEQEPVPADVEVRPLVGGFGETSGFAVTHTNLALGEYWLVIVNTSPWATSATVRLYGTAGVARLASDTGSEGGLWRESDFASSEESRHVRTGAATLTVQEHHVRNGTRDVTIENHLFGLFAANRGERREISIVLPNGSVDRPRVVSSMTLSARASGPYTFRLDAWDVATRAGLGPDAYVVLLVADVRLP